MTRKEARAHINKRLPYELTKATAIVSGHDTYVCPLCSNGSGESGTGICTKDGKHYKCFVCGFFGDYLDLLKKQSKTGKEWDIFMSYGLEIKNEPTKVFVNVQSAETEKRAVHVTITQDNEAAHPFMSANEVSSIKTHNGKSSYAEHMKTHYDSSLDEKLLDKTARYLRQCHDRAGHTCYFSDRGISAEVVNRFKLGFDPKFRHPRTKSKAYSARVIIPMGDGETYFTRTVDGDDGMYSKQNVYGSELFNAKALQCKKSQYIFITEGAFDALSVIEVGGQSVALGGTNNVGLLETAIRAYQPTATLVLSLDNDTEGRKVQKVLKERLDNMKIPCIEANISGNHKDPNECLIYDRATFEKMVADPTMPNGGRAESYKNVNSVSGGLDGFMQTVRKSIIKAIPTGFEMFDGILDGGFYEGLHILGAISGIGKTSLCLQIADQVAQSGKDVLIFSLEMPKHMLMAKTLSRLTFIEDNTASKGGNSAALSSQQITTGAFSGEREKQLVDNALQKYRQDSQHLYIYEGVGSPSCPAAHHIK